MCTLKETKYSLSNVSSHVKVAAVELALEQCLTRIQELVMDYEQIKLNYKDYESQYLTQKEKCESKTCSSSLELIRINDTKDNIIQSIASAVTKLNETRDFNTINEIFSIICGEHTPPSQEPRRSQPETIQNNNPQKCKEAICDESLSEIEGTPTGRKSPIIFSKASKNITRDNKKKCPENWCSPETKTIKLSKTPTRSSNGKLIQTRLITVKSKPNCFVDLTNSPELKSEKITLDPIQMNIKQEELDDETILPSPSGLVNFQSLHKSLKCSPHKFKKPNLSLKQKLESVTVDGKGRSITDENMFDFKVNPDRLNSPMKLEIAYTEQVADESISLLHQMCKFDVKTEEPPKPGAVLSLRKQPLAQNSSLSVNKNNNMVNIKNQFDTENSVSILKTTSPPASTAAVEENVKRIKNMEPVCKEPTVRKRAEKRALPGWSCEECKLFYDELYKDNPDMLAKKMDECSKHRGRHNPVRPKTPTGYWNPRWDVPTDTEEFNRRNNAL